MNNDLHQWYLDINNSLEGVKKYEDLIEDYYKNLHFTIDRQLIKPFLSGFYKKDPFKKHVKDIILDKFFLSGIVALVIAVLSVLYQIFTFDDGVWAAFGEILPMLKVAAIVGGISLIVVCALMVVFNFINHKRIVKTLAKLEEELKPIMITIPSHYRSYNKMTLISQTYFAVKGVLPDQALQVCDDNLDKLPERSIPGIMFDLPFKNSLIKDPAYTAGESKIETSEIGEDYEYTNEFLPSDIKQKTFQGSNNAEEDLNKMIGLDSVKEQIEKLKSRIAYFGSTGNGGNHMAFLGGAGTGKTSVSRVVTKILYDLGYIKKNQYVEISGDYLRSGSSDRAAAIIEYSYGGVLFIDEAYLLYDKNGRGNEAIGILLKAMEDHRKDFVCILAGYEEQMTRLIASNEGFSSRIKHTIYFPDYTVDEMFDIFLSFIDNYNGKKYSISEDAVPLLKETFELEKKSSSFGNARTVRNAVDTIMDYYVDRNIQNNSDTKIIELSDVEKYNQDRRRIILHELKNSSAVNQIDESIIRLSELKSKLHTGAEQPIQAFNEMVGLETLNEPLQLLKNQKEFYNEVKPQKILIVGDCGKSTIASILTGYLYQLGYIQENKYLEISAEFFKGSYVGHTTKRAEAIISYASGGVLLIKNINRLVNSSDSFDVEVLGVINDAINNNENVCIIVGDTDSTYIRNMSSAFDIIYNIPTYTKEQLCQIFINQAKQDGFTVNDDAISKIKTMISTNTSVRLMLNYYNNAKKKHMSNFTEENKYIISAEDIEMPVIRLSIRK